jgi:quercetin dioxygenase-like cupin family protein
MTDDLSYSNAQGEHFQFLHTAQATGGQYIDFVWTIPHRQVTDALHSHPFQTETIEVLAGQLSVTIDNHERRLYAGDLVIVPRGALHTCQNIAESVTQVRVMFQPALDTQEVIAAICQLSQSPAVPTQSRLYLSSSYIIWPAATR